MISAIIKIASSLMGMFFDSNEVKAVKEAGKLDIAKLELELKKSHMESEAKAEADYDSQAMKNMQTSWKDEYLILLHTMPIWAYGIPSETLHEGLDRIWFQFNNADYWWWICYVGMIASTFGLRWLFSKKIDKILEKRDAK